jgi:hypothetical protein
MEFVEYGCYLDSNRLVMASAQYFGRIMRHHDSFEK